MRPSIKKIINGKDIYRLFPYVKNSRNKDLLKIDDESVNYITTKNVAYDISTIIAEHFDELNYDPLDIIITDAMAGVGGNTISFSTSFKFVNSIEMDKTRYEYLKNNCEIYQLKNIKFYNDDLLNIIFNINHNIVYFDPPWGGKDYKNHNNIRIIISEHPLEYLVNKLLDKTRNKSSPELIVLKLPKNYDLYYFYKTVESNHIYLHKLKKMIIVVVYNYEKINKYKEFIDIDIDININNQSESSEHESATNESSFFL